MALCIVILYKKEKNYHGIKTENKPIDLFYLQQEK